MTLNLLSTLIFNIILIILKSISFTQIITSYISLSLNSLSDNSNTISISQDSQSSNDSNIRTQDNIQQTRKSIISSFLFNNDKDYIQLFFTIKLGLFLFLLILGRGLLKLCVYGNQNENSTLIKFFGYFINVLNFGFNTFYIVFVVLCLMTFINLPENSIFDNSYSTVLLGFYTIIGVIDLLEKFIFVIVLIFSIPYYVSLITTNSKEFFIKYGTSEVNSLFIFFYLYIFRF